MFTKFYDSSVNDDTVKLLSNPLNNENLQFNELEIHDESKLNIFPTFCIRCCSSPQKEASNMYFTSLNNDSCVYNNVSSDCHAIPTSHKKTTSGPRLFLALSLCLIFMIAEMIGGYIAGSVAVVNDGAHLVTDVFGFILSLVALSSSKKESTTKFNLGFYRIEILTTLTSILIVWIMTFILLYIAITRLLEGNYIIEVNIMILISAVGVLINIVMFLVLHGACYTSHKHTFHKPREDHFATSQNINVRAAIIHVLGDLIQSIGVCISSVVIKFFPDAKFMDSVCTILFSFVVLFSTVKLLKDSVHILMEGFPKHFDYNTILTSLQCLNGVHQVHGLCVWSLTVDKNILIVHIAVDDTADRDVILLQAQNIISTKFGIHHHTIQIEKYQSKCVDSSRHCMLFRHCEINL